MIKKRLDWDSNFFGFKVGLIIINSEDEISLVLQVAQEFRLCYIFCQTTIDRKLIENISSEIKFVDQKVRYLKELKGVAPSTISCVCSAAHKDYEELIPLSIVCGKFSRFATDSNIPRAKYEELYVEWLRKSIIGEMADIVLCTRDSNVITGMISVSKKENYCEIGLVSVHSNYQGRGIGKILLAAAEQFAITNSFDKIYVVTQKFNLPACKLYEGHGFSITEQLNTFHYWNDTII